MMLVGSSNGRVANPPPVWVASDLSYDLAVGDAFSLDLDTAAVDPRGDTLTFTITGTLPAGVTRTGNVLSGTVTTAESASITVTAADSEGLERDTTISWEITAEDTTPPAVPGGFDDPIVDVQTLSFTISPFTEADFSHIEVWGSDASDGTYTQLSPTIQYETDFISISRSGLTHSTAYYHKLKSVDADGNTSAFSEVYSLTTSAPPQPTWEADASLSWTAGTPTTEVSTLTDAGNEIAADCFLESADDITGLTITDPGGPGTRDVTLSYDGTGSTAARTITVQVVADDDPAAPPDGGTGNPDYEFLFPQPFPYDSGDKNSNWDGVLNHSGNQIPEDSNLFVTQAGVQAWKCQLTRGSVSGERFRNERSVSPNSSTGFRLNPGYTYWFGMGIYFPSDGGWGTAKRTQGNSTTNVFQFHDVADKDSSGKFIDVAGRPTCLFYMSDDSIIRDEAGRVEFAMTCAGDPAKVSVAGSPTFKRYRVPLVADMRSHFDAWKSFMIAYTPHYDINAAVPPRMRVWFDNTLVLDKTEINCFNDDVQGYAKFGNYNPPWKASGFESTWTALAQMVHYYSRFRIKVIAGSDTAATGYADVDPGF